MHALIMIISMILLIFWTILKYELLPPSPRLLSLPHSRYMYPESADLHLSYLLRFYENRIKQEISETRSLENISPAQDILHSFALQLPLSRESCLPVFTCSNTNTKVSKMSGHDWLFYYWQHISAYFLSYSSISTPEFNTGDKSSNKAFNSQHQECHLNKVYLN